MTETRALDKVIRIDEAQVQTHLSEMVRSSVEETLNALGARVERLKEEGFAEAKEEEGRIDLPSSHPSVTLPLDAFVPVSYVEDDSTRLALYQRMAAMSVCQSMTPAW